MRIFQRYNPPVIARYVKGFFRGRVYIKGIGAFEFDQGKILLPKTKDKQHYSVMSEINRHISELHTEIA
ncbi:MAG: DUF1107 domain-containing protein [Plesiomonas sp.]|uniref:DUF1107 domain-containing protein n=1 Tax=Plesiomonas sp. TaxID=2486279 RepID=UPI003F3580F7